MKSIQSIIISLLLIHYSSDVLLVWYIILFNLPVVLIIFYLFCNNSKHTTSEPVHFDHKPMSYFVYFCIITSIELFYVKMKICMQLMNILMNWRIQIILLFIMYIVF